VVERLAPSYERGMLTNGPLVRELEETMAERLGVRHVVAVSGCTSGLMLAIRALEPAGPVLLPSFTFSASAHAVAWNGLGRRFAECTTDSFQLDLHDASERLDGVGAVMATHIFGAPCDPHSVEQLGARAGVPVVFDAAHALGAMHHGTPVGGFGDVEVFSMSPTKPVVAGEGGLVSTNRDDVAQAVRMGRDYGNPGDYDTRFVGLNARLSELHAAVALESVAELDEHLVIRRALAQRYSEGLREVPGILFQRYDTADQHTWKDLTVRVEPGHFGCNRDLLVRALRAEGIDTRNYFDPPVHRQRSHRDPAVSLPVTDSVASSVVSLPLYRSLDPSTVDEIVEVIAAVQARSGELAAA
jgi:dTDP-4-amino-4,6-dideoxygalactose transaminase